MNILGIETSCDETSAAVVRDGSTLLSNVVASSIDLNVAYGGVVPEIAARSHIELIMPVIEQALEQAFGSDGDDAWQQIDAIAVTYGPGLGGSLLIGVMTARTLAIAKDKPLYAVDHVNAHTFALFIKSSKLPDYSLPKSVPKFPILSLVISGGHTQLVLYSNYFEYKVLGQTRDDAVGEAFDKVAKILGLPYPGGPSLSKCAAEGTADFPLPKARLENAYDFSFSGLKTAVLRTAQSVIGEDFRFPSIKISAKLDSSQKANIAASFEDTAINTLTDKLLAAYNQYHPASIVVSGGVAANKRLRSSLETSLPISAIYPDIKLCTDNGAMIATCGYFMIQENMPKADKYSLDINPGLSM